MLVDFARVNRSALRNKPKEELCPFPAECRPGVHQSLKGACHEAVVDEEVLFDAELREAPLQVTRLIVDDTVAQDEVLGARWRPDGVGLHETEFMQRALQGCRREQAAGDGEATKVVQGNRHEFMMPKDAAGL